MTNQGCDGRIYRPDAAAGLERVGPRCGEPHIFEITRKRWDRPVRLCRLHAERMNLTDAEAATLAETVRALSQETAPREGPNDAD